MSLYKTLFLTKSKNDRISSKDIKNTIYPDLIQIQPYKKYIALLSQSGTSAPTAIILENTLGTIIWGRTSAGIYTATLTNAFSANKTTIFHGTSADATYVAMNRTNASVITITVIDSDGSTPVDSLIVGGGNVLIEIRVYP